MFKRATRHYAARVMSEVENLVVGGGAMGAAAALSLARRGREVLLLERFDIGHDRGSSHTHSRILRFAYFEHPDYSRLVQTVHPMWRNLERESGSELMVRCGGVDIGPPDGELVVGSLRACRELGLEHEYLSRSELSARFPWVHHEEVAGVHQPDACILAPSACVRVMAELARSHGATIHERSPVVEIDPRADHVSVVTGNARYRARCCVVTAGAWTGRLLAGLHLPLEVVRKVVAFFEPRDAARFERGRFPIFIYQTGDCFYYGFPVFGRSGVKVGDHAGSERVNPDHPDRSFRPEDESHIRAFLRRHLPDADGRCLEHLVCLYTLTSDNDFIIDRHPFCDRMLIAAGFSGHGFKFAPVVGEILADLATSSATSHPIGRFSAKRFG